MGIPRTEPELVGWLNNFAAKLPPYTSLLSIDISTMELVVQDAAMLRYLVNELLPSYQTALQTRTAYKNALKDGPLGAVPPPKPPQITEPEHPDVIAPGIMPRLRQLVARIKASPNYTESIGRDLGIIDEAPAAPVGPIKPTAKAVPLPGGGVRIEFSKAGFDGVLIEGSRGGEAGFSRLATDNYSPYLDARPPLEAGKPEVRQYRLRYLQRDEPVGDWSDILSATTTP